MNPAPRILPASGPHLAKAAAEGARAIRAGRLVAFPTETVYGLGADATNPRAVAAVFAAKDRPRFNPLIVHVPSAAEARPLARFDVRADALAAAFWPGPLTLVLPRADAPLERGASFDARGDSPARRCPVAPLVSAGLDTLALRAPDHAVAQALLRACGLPVAAPSANPSGRTSPTTAAHVAAMLEGRVDLILDGGPCRIGLESTVLDLSGAIPRILRLGAIAAEDIAKVLGTAIADASGEAADDDEERLSPGRLSPGMARRHYAPRARLRLNATAARPGETLLAFGRAPKTEGEVRNLSPTGDLVEAAANLFAMLHQLDRLGVAAIAVMPIPDIGLGRAINDRLRRAAAR
jgi:L-threonylcarbamoyladenylate synthase